jgi:hypothetical protein
VHIKFAGGGGIRKKTGSKEVWKYKMGMDIKLLCKNIFGGGGGINNLFDIDNCFGTVG